MQCFIRFKYLAHIAFLVFVLFAGGSFSSLRGTILEATPATFQSKLLQMVPGDVLQLRNGNYGHLNASSIQIPVGTGWSSTIKIQSYPGERATFRGITLYAAYPKYLWFDGLLIDRENDGSNEAVVISQGANHIRLSNCEIKRSSGSGILTHYHGGYHEFINLDVHDNGFGVARPDNHGIYLGSANCLIQGGRYWGNSSYGIQLYSGYGLYVNNNIVRGVEVFKNQINMGATGKAGVVIAKGAGNQLLDSFIHDELSNGVNISYDASSTIVKGNKFANIPSYTIEVFAGISGTQLINNCTDPLKIRDNGSGTVKQNNNPTGCSGSTTPPPPTNVDVTQNPPVSQPPVYQPPSNGSQPSGPSTSQVAMPFLIAGVLVAALVLGD